MTVRIKLTCAYYILWPEPGRLFVGITETTPPAITAAIDQAPFKATAVAAASPTTMMNLFLFSGTTI